MITLGRSVFKNHTEDFFKIIFPTIIIILLSSFFNFQKSTWYFFLLAFILDQGHVYSTMIEVYLDPNELRKPYVSKITLLSFFLNIGIIFLFPDFFFYYLFYFTVYHNMRQGLGFVFISQTKDNISRNFVKWAYYFSTVFPFVLFHFRYNSELSLSQAILKNVNLFKVFPYHYLSLLFKIGLGVYIAIWLPLVVFLYRKKFEGFIMFVFFSLVYSIAFLVMKSSVNSYALLILSHAIPYYFLFEERIHLTHGLSLVKRYSHLWMVAFFALGALVDYLHEDIFSYFEFPFDKIIVAVLFTPLICHFIFDSVLWKRENEKYRLQKLLRSTY